MAHLLATMLPRRGVEAFVYCTKCGAVIATWDQLLKEKI